jgi:hypothetical protein
MTGQPELETGNHKRTHKRPALSLNVRQYRPNLRVALQDVLEAAYISGRRSRAAGTTMACSMVGTFVPRSFASASASLSG